VSHVDPEVLALRALGEVAGTTADDVHLPGCAICQAEIERLRKVVTIAREDDQPVRLAAPADAVWARIAQELGSDIEEAVPAELASRGAAPEHHRDVARGGASGTGADGTRARQRDPWWRRPLAVAAAAGLVVGAAVTVGIRQIVATPAPTVVASIPLRPLPQFPQWKGSAGNAVMERSAGGTLLSVTLRAPSRPGFYEVWLLARDGVKMISLGDLNSAHKGVFAMPPGVDLANYSRIDVSLQPFNGSTLHSRDSVVRGSLP
jgi:Anti-sigma-K factor rskA